MKKIDAKVIRTMGVAIVTILLSTMSFSGLYAAVEQDSVYSEVDRLPKFACKPSRTDQFIARHLIYPDEPWKNGLEGVVTVSFTVTKDGRLMDAKVEKGVDPLLDLEALRVIDLMETWKPAKKNGEIVHSRVILPVVFSLSEDEKNFIATMKRFGLDVNVPLYVLDNQIMRARVHLPEYNIKSIRVLKGDAAIEKYGEEAKNGVVVITTKRGTPPLR
jgi:TonB family protein